jgi:predicted nucleic acid-binding protein
MPTNDALFVDTSSWASYFDQTDPLHAAVVALVASAIRQHRLLVTTEYIVAELVSLFVSRHVRMPHTAMVAAVTLLKTEPAIQIEYIDPTTSEQAWRLVVSRPDKQWSLVDAKSFVIMWRLGITEAITADHHFEQAGFIRVPLP